MERDWTPHTQSGWALTCTSFQVADFASNCLLAGKWRPDPGELAKPDGSQENPHGNKDQSGPMLPLSHKARG